MQENLISTNGVILSAMPVGESDRRLLLLTKELGKVSCFAHGVRKPTSPMVGRTRPFSFGRFDLFPGRDAYTLRTAEITEYFEPIVLDPVKSAVGSCFLELASRVSVENTDGSALLQLVYAALSALTKDKMEPRLILLTFQAKVLAFEGVLPEFKTCVKCRKPLETAVFQPSYLNVLCPDCAPEDQGYPLSRSALYALSFIRETPPGKLFSFAVTDSVYKELSAVVARLMAHMLEKPLSSMEMLKVFMNDL
ncbi:MAG: DNA repair protein RecO [Lachnospiraceae bacterium]|nr:DNA repair protein RecO [Lachnospiraceae bacterium]